MKRSRWMEGLLLAERWCQDDGSSEVSRLYLETEIKGFDDPEFEQGFDEYCDYYETVLTQNK